MKTTQHHSWLSDGSASLLKARQKTFYFYNFYSFPLTWLLAPVVLLPYWTSDFRKTCKCMQFPVQRLVISLICHFHGCVVKLQRKCPWWRGNQKPAVRSLFKIIDIDPVTRSSAAHIFLASVVSACLANTIAKRGPPRSASTFDVMIVLAGPLLSLAECLSFKSMLQAKQAVLFWSFWQNRLQSGPSMHAQQEEDSKHNNATGFHVLKNLSGDNAF